MILRMVTDKCYTTTHNDWRKFCLLTIFVARNPTLIPNTETCFFPQELVHPTKEGEISKIRFPAPTRLKVGNYPHVNLFYYR